MSDYSEDRDDLFDDPFDDYYDSGNWFAYQADEYCPDCGRGFDVCDCGDEVYDPGDDEVDYDDLNEVFDPGDEDEAEGPRKFRRYD